MAGIGDSALGLPETLLMDPDPAGPDASLADEFPDGVIGRYRILEPIGEGGFGIVYRAEQTEPIKREVALKVIKPGMDSRQVIRRFEAERQTLARMEHPNIAAVFDAGTTRNGRPYFVMELVRGEPVTDYCDRHRLTVAQRLSLFVPVCRAVQHAHQKGALHRDLKPSNILVAEVDGKAVPKVIDFGIAKALDAPAMGPPGGTRMATIEGMVIGTPCYMSPEQAGAAPDLDTRSDIYTLGVILFQLLTGQTPLSPESLHKAALDEMLRLVREAPPVRRSSRVTPASRDSGKTSTARRTEPGKLNRTLRGDLDWITLKALEKERERRYSSAAALAQDLESYLAGEPVAAGPPGRWYRLRKLIRRHRVAFGVSGAIVILLAAGVGVSTWQWLEATRARDAASRLRLDLLIKAIDDDLKLGAWQEALGKIAEAREAAPSLSGDLLFKELEAMDALQDPSLAKRVNEIAPLSLRADQKPLLDFWRAGVLLQDGNHDAALRSYQESLAGTLPPVEEALARAAVSETVAAATEHCRKAVDLAPWRPDARRNLTLALLLSGRIDEAGKSIEFGHTLFPKDGTFDILLALLEIFQGNAAAARAAAARVPAAYHGAGSFFQSIADPAAIFCQDIIRGLCGAKAKMSVWDIGKLVAAIAGQRLNLRRGESIPGFPAVPPVLSKGLYGLVDGLRKYQTGDRTAAAGALREALRVCDEGTLWALLGLIEWERENDAAAIEALRKSQATPALLRGTKEAARLLEGAAEARIFWKQGDTGARDRAGQAFVEFFRTDLPKESVRLLAENVAISMPDKLLARLLADQMPAGSIERLRFQARIEFADGNAAKALQLAEQALAQRPGDAALQTLRDSIANGTLDPRQN